ncbi:MAG: SIS domain-containing protein [Candidatus Limnocylindria bacterium]
MSLAREIAEQPRVLVRLLADGGAEARAIGRTLRAAEHLTIAARGSSDNAATYGKYLFEGHAGVVTALAAPSLVTRYGTPPGFARGAVIGISQSGAAPDVAAVLDAGRSSGARTIAITNVARSRVARSADAVLAMRAGPERSVAATKTYTATCLALALLASSCAEARGRDPIPTEGLAEAVEEAVGVGDEAARLAGRIGRARALVILGRGLAYPMALEAALKVKELARIWAEPYSSADLAHGPIALLGPDTPAVVMSTRGTVERDARDLARRLRARGVRVLAITNDERLAESADGAVLLRAAPHEAMAVIALVVVAQLLAAELARRRGLDPDRPTGLTKVTRTR